MKRVLSLTWVFIFIGSIVSFGQEISDEAQKYYDRGCTALEMIKDNEPFVDYNDAIMEFNKAKELAPNFKDVYLKLGHTYSKLKKYQEAIENYKKYIQLETDTNEVSQIKTIINKLEYKSEKNRELMPSTYKDVNVGDVVAVEEFNHGHNVSWERRTITTKCIGKNDTIARLEYSEKILSVFEGEIVRDLINTWYMTYNISDPVVDSSSLPDGGYSIENIGELSERFSKEKKIADGLRYLKINNITLRCYWSKTKSSYGFVYERWFSNKIPLIYLIKQITYVDGREVSKTEVKSWHRGS